MLMFSKDALTLSKLTSKDIYNVTNDMLVIELFILKKNVSVSTTNTE